MVSAPRVDGKLVLVREGQTFTVRVFSGSTVFGFILPVLRACSRPYPYLHLEYPKSLEKLVLRKAQRVTVNLIAAIQRPATGSGSAETQQPQPAVIMDLSTAGARLEFAEDLGEPGELITVAARFDTSKVHEYLTLPAVIRNKQGYGETDEQGVPKYEYGVEFQLDDQNTELVLHAYVYERIVQNLEK